MIFQSDWCVYQKSHYRDKTILCDSYLHSGISCTDDVEIYTDIDSWSCFNIKTIFPGMGFQLKREDSHETIKTI